MNFDYEFIIPWSEFPDSFLEKWEREIFLTDTEDDGVVCDINFDFTPYCPGRYDGHPDKMYPASGPDLDINSVCITVYQQRAGMSQLGIRTYWSPAGYTTVATDHLRPLDDKFLETAHQFAMDWLDLNEERVDSHLIAWAATQKVENEIDSIFTEMEASEGYI